MPQIALSRGSAPFLPEPALTVPGAAVAPDLLTDIQLRVARRADELARARRAHTSLDLDCWLIAETEVLRGSYIFPERLFARM